MAGNGSTIPGGFVSRLQGIYPDQNLVNLGVPGDTTADGLARVDDIFSHDPKIVLLLLGGNDYVRRVPKEQTFKNLKSIITTIQSHRAMVILIGVRGGLLKDNYESDYHDLALKTGSAYIPNILDGLLGNKDLMSDEIHPNDRGYDIVTNKITPVLSQFLM